MTLCGMICHSRHSIENFYIAEHDEAILVIIVNDYLTITPDS